jgi:hypothetical protein
MKWVLCTLAWLHWDSDPTPPPGLDTVITILKYFYDSSRYTQVSPDHTPSILAIVLLKKTFKNCSGWGKAVMANQKLSLSGLINIKFQTIFINSAGLQAFVNSVQSHLYRIGA